MIDTIWTTAPALVAGGPAVGVAPRSAAVPAPVCGTRGPSARLRALAAGRPFGAGAAADGQHPAPDFQNTTTLGIHSPGRPLS